MKLFDFFINPSKRVRYLLNTSYKRKNHNPSYILNKRIKKLKLKENHQLVTNEKITSYLSVFSKLFLLIVLTIFIGFITYFHFRSDNSHNAEITIKNLSIPLIETITSNYINFLLVAPMVIFIIGSLLWMLGFYLYNSFLKFATIFLSVAIGFWIGMLYAFVGIFSKHYPPFNFLFFIPFLGTIFVISLMSCLYYLKKINISEKKRNFISALFFILYFIHIGFTLSKFGFDNWFLNFIMFFLAILDLVLGAWMWVINLENIDIFIEQKIPQKYEWLLISILLIASLHIFIAIFNIITIIFRTMDDEK